MDPMESIKQTYFQECDELLVAMEEGLLAMEGGEADDEIINAVFRAVHSIKGGGGAFGFDALVTFAHGFETVLDDIRSQKLIPTPDVMRVLLKAGDVLSDHVAAIRDGRALADDHGAEIAADLATLSGAGGGVEEPAPVEFEGIDFRPMQIAVDEAPDTNEETKGWRIKFVPQANLYAKANDPALIFRELMRLGPVETTCDLTRLPELASLEPDQAYLAWDLTLSADAPRSAVEDVFEFVTDDCDLDISELATLELAPEPAQALSGQHANSVPQLRPEAVEMPAPVEAKGSAPAEIKKPDTVKQTIRVDLDKVDRLVNLVGELVITQAMLTQQVHESDVARMSEVGTGLAELDHLLRELQESVMAIRTQPVKSVFQRMPRLVRELAAQTNKQVRLVLEGEGTEVDKTVIEHLGEPLTHMIRNAVDHGLESTEDRIAAGKPAEGTVTLSARHIGGRIMIEIIDDGRGINRERVRAKAIEKRIIAPNALLSDEEIDDLIFMPGFSTASQVSNISGRGVGMDVVRRNIAELGGRVIISSTPNKGSRFSLTLPLTLAVLDGMVVTVGDQTFVLPLSHIAETLRPKAEDLRPFGVNHNLLRIRNTYVPLADIGRLLGIARNGFNPASGVAILVESEGAGRYALAADAILGQRQVVIKSFEGNYRAVEGIAAATILGDGRVALILDVDALVARCRENSGGRTLETLERRTGT